MTRQTTTWPATARYGLGPAPAGLAFVQDLLNTAPAGRPPQPDLLGELAAAQHWLDAARAGWAAATGRAPGPVTLTAQDTAALRDFRDSLRQQMTLPAGTASAEPPLPQQTVILRPDLSGHVHAEPRGDGWHAVAALVLIEIYQAQLAGTWRRLKICRNQRCASAFYDRSRNNSGVWHDVRTCGNQANLRAYRARQRSAPGGRAAEGNLS
jgi:predicted RNA-binding Zn ribbon-like protein